MKDITIFTDGSCLGNPGNGGYAALLRYGETTRELGGGFANTTNNRMELLAVIEALSALKERCNVTLFTDSMYVRNAVEKKWLAGWQKNAWKNSAKKPVKNKNLWVRLIPLLAAQDVSFKWVRGHSGHPENERCDEIAKGYAALPNLPKDAREEV